MALIPPVQSTAHERISFVPVGIFGLAVFLIGLRVREPRWRWSLALDAILFVVFGLIVIERVKFGFLR